MLHPGIHLACGQAEGNGAAQREDVVLVGEVVRRRQRHLDRAVLYAIDDAEGRHQLAGRVHADLEAPGRQGLERARKGLGRTEDGVQRLGKARSQPPAHRARRRLLRLDGGCGRRRQHTGHACMFDE
jgi:hypothetical protein